ncbi:hypothetical protein ACFL2K_00040 [Candidatus Margulisiibacteriota bacterium]
MLFSITVSETNNEITAKAQDNVGNISPESTAVSVNFGSKTKAVSTGDVDIIINCPFGSLDTDSDPTLSLISTPNLTATYGPAPQYYKYLLGFDLGFEGVSATLNVSGNLEVELTFDYSAAVTSSIKVYSLVNDTSWSSEEITRNSVTFANSKTTVNFTPSHFSTFMVADLIDPNKPIIDPVKIDGSYITTDNYFSATPVVSVKITDPDSNISSWSIQVIEKEFDIVKIAASATGLTIAEVTAITTSNTALDNGTYYVKVTAGDNNTNTTTRISPDFKVNSSGLNFSALHAPNPFNPNNENLVIGFNLSQEAGIEIYILDQSGDIIKTWVYDSSSDEGQPGYHTISWNGRNTFGNIVPNGLYFGYLVAKNSSSTSKIKLKIAVLR